MMVRKHLALIELLVQSPYTQRQALLSNTQLNAVLEAIYNVLKGTCPINDKKKKKLNRYKQVIRRLVSSEVTHKQRHRLLIKHRRLLPSLLKPVIEMFQSR